MVFKKITLIGRSNESFEDATTDAIDRAEETLEQLKWATITDQSVELATASEREFQVEIEAAFELQEGVSE
ncbi:dodecin [Natronomonas salsuginis]|uniref:Dodecin domain-containing protein n=1 Tax=Natronomonas salsuginis TaxID=2217661 RepID=A0A4U5JFY6_9EURY|nr:dodecin [Natronomonas salsuginis]TKR27705.1 dodecin domain-containing protein [Natronomonas salsuginis]